MFGSLGSPQTLNRYAYVTNNPVNLTDSTGMMIDASRDWESVAATLRMRDPKAAKNNFSEDNSAAEADFDQRAQNTYDAAAAGNALLEGNYERVAQILDSNSNVGLSVEGVALWGEFGAAFSSGYGQALSQTKLASIGGFGLGGLLNRGWCAVADKLSKIRGPDFQLVNVNAVAGITRFIARGDDMSTALQGVSAGGDAQAYYAVGWMIQRATPSKDEIRDWGSGLSFSTDFFFIGGGGFLFSPKYPKTPGVYAGFGAGTGVGGSFNYPVP
jgi:hypothetical protein